MTLPYFTYVAFAGMFVAVLSLRLKANGIGIDRETRTGLMAIALLLLTSCLFAENRSEALLQLTNWLPYFWFFALLPLILNRLEHLENLATNLVIAALPLNAIALIEYLLRSPWLPRPYRRNPFLHWLRNRPHTGRAMTVFEHPNWFANFLILILGLSLGLLYSHLRQDFRLGTLKFRLRPPQPCPPTHCPPPSDPAKIQNPKSKIQNATLLLTAILTTLIAIFCSGSRNGLIIALIQLTLFTLALIRTHRRILWVTLLTGLGLLAAVMKLGIGGRSLSPLTWLNDPRLRSWQIAWDLIQARPLFGWGLGSFKLEFPDRLLALDPTCAVQRIYLRQIPELCEFVLHPHNVWLLLASEAGVGVTVALSLWVGRMGWRSLRLFLSQTLPPSEQGILLAYLLAFFGGAAFGLFDVTLYDARINAVNWVILAGIYRWAKK